MKINPTLLDHGQLDEMNFTLNQQILLHSQPNEFVDEIVELIRCQAQKQQLSLFEITLFPQLNRYVRGMDYIQLFTYTQEQLQQALTHWECDETLLKKKIDVLSQEEYLQLQGLFVQLAQAKIVILHEHVPFLNSSLFEKLQSLPISFIVISSFMHQELSFHEIWQVKGNRCLFIQ